MWPFKRKQWEKAGNALTSEMLHRVLVTLFPENIFLRDRDYRAISSTDFERLIFNFWFPNDLSVYKNEIFDCDDFAVCFLADIKKGWAKRSHGREALAFGYISADIKDGAAHVLHAFIWQLNDKKEINFYEPQTGKKTSPEILGVILVET